MALKLARSEGDGFGHASSAAAGDLGSSWFSLGRSCAVIERKNSLSLLRLGRSESRRQKRTRKCLLRKTKQITANSTNPLPLPSAAVCLFLSTYLLAERIYRGHAGCFVSG